ncbi:lipopolysaccharide biosynthesis protein [Streptomyces ficellus]|uniref:Lipopolysaccharide biosynthesis protein n=1 Tax=Streptomyces ficellus TaxID=1977088 RepID=A0A6I6FD40_9ACTN|nr:lipopolysaccharide biosynthesis protein [Streptomyces ficellus]QGV78002.1 lipopolysaccharide biosynthesis protein [Streptomyces ficellus]
MSTAGRTALTRPDRPAHPDETRAVHGARWIAVASLAVGVLNYGYALLLTRLLDVQAYAVFAAGQGLVLSVATVALVSIPWVLAQALARARTDTERAEAVRFATVAATLGALVTAAAVAAVASRFASPATVLVLAAGTFLIFVTTVTVGWLQGTERMRTLACVTTGEAVLKVAVGLLLVSVLGLSDTGALAALGIAVLPFLLWWPRGLGTGGQRPRFAVRAYGDLWRRAGKIAALQGLVALLSTIDVVVITVLPTDRAAAASYQASVMVGRIPLFLAGAIAMAFLPALARRSAGTPLAASAVRMYLTVALPFTVVCATAPQAVLTTVFPAGYAMMSTLLVFTAISGLAVGALTLAATFCQAVDDFGCLRQQLLGLAVYVAALVVGWRAGGVVGLAGGVAVGTLVATVLLVGRLIRRQGFGALVRPSLVAPLLLTALFLALRGTPVLWTVAATAVGAYGTVRFLRHRSPAEPSRPSLLAGRPPSAPAGAETVRLLTDAVWHGLARRADDQLLRRALVLAQRNRVAGRLARRYPDRLAGPLADADRANDRLRANLAAATGLLTAAGVPAVVIRADADGGHGRDDFDLVVPEDRWSAADRALTGWYRHRSRYWLERSTKVLLEPVDGGPAAHLHRTVSWYGVPVIPTGDLFARAVPHHGDGDRDGGRRLVPDPADQLRIRLAHALFRNQTLDLSDLLAIRPLLTPGVTARAQRAAEREGWPLALRAALTAATDAIERLDRGQTVRLPLPLPVPLSLRAGLEHAGGLLRSGRRGPAARELALRVPLVLAKKLRRADL